MAKEDRLESFSSEQLQAGVANALMEQFAAEAKARAQSAEQKIHKKYYKNPRKIRLGASGKSRKMMVEAVRKAFEQALGGREEVWVLRTRNARHAKIVRAVAEALPEAVERRQLDLQQSQIDALVDVYLQTDALAPALADIVRDNAEARADFIGKVHMLTAEQVADLAGHEAKNRSVTASRWKKAGSIFSVRHKGNDLYPIFQFKDQAPHPAVAKILAALPGAMSGWQIAFWFVGGNGWLAGARPVDRLDDVDAVLAAARHEGEAWTG